MNKINGRIKTVLGGVVLFFASVLVCHAAPQLCFHPPQSPVSWWSGDGDTLDLTGGNNGMLLGNATFAPGLINDAFSLDGDGDWVDFGSDPAYDFASSDFTISMWVNWNTLSGEQVLIEKWDNGPSFGGTQLSGWSLTKFLPDTVQFAMVSGGVFQPINATLPGIAVGVWNHIAVTRVSGAVTIYWNGSPVGSGVVPTFDSTPNPLIIGRRNDSRGFFHNGLFDDVQIYDIGLSAAEIGAIVSADCGVK